MTRFYIYLMPYMTRAGLRWYCGQTNDPSRREVEHLLETKRHWLAPAHVIGIQDRGDPNDRWGLLVVASEPWHFGNGFFDVRPITSRKAVMAAERFVKRQSAFTKSQAYRVGLNVEALVT